VGRFRRSGSPFPLKVSTRCTDDGTLVLTLYNGSFDRVVRCTVISAGRENRFWSEWPCGKYTDPPDSAAGAS
jgi:hypothetical protein